MLKLELVALNTKQKCDKEELCASANETQMIRSLCTD